MKTESGCFRGFQGVEEGFRGFQGVEEGFKGFQGVEEGFRGFQRVEGFQWGSEGGRGVGF